MISELGFLDRIRDLSRDLATAERRVRKNRRMQDRLHKGVRVRNQRFPVDEPRRAIRITQIERHRNDGGVEGRGPALVRRIAYHAVFPDVMRRAVKIYALFFKNDP